MKGHTTDPKAMEFTFSCLTNSKSSQNMALRFYSLGGLSAAGANLPVDLQTMGHQINAAEVPLPVGIRHKQVELHFAAPPPEFLGTPRTNLQLQQALILPMGETPSHCTSPPHGGGFVLRLREHQPHYIEYQGIVGGRVVRLLCHQIKSAWRRVMNGLPALWNQQTHQCFHRCHKGPHGCTRTSHVLVRERHVNQTASNHHCCAYYECFICGHKMIYCTHWPRCTRVEYTRCYPACPTA